MTSAFTSLAAPSLEDTMEVSSSPAGNIFDTDIDIDFDDYHGGVHVTDDEHMLEDGDPTRPPTATDEMMDDDDHATTLVEELMQDDPPQDNAVQPEPLDEELIDYDDENDQDVDQSFLDDTTLQNTQNNFAAPTETVQGSEQLGEEVIRETEKFADSEATVESQALPAVENAEPVEDPAQQHEFSEMKPALGAQTEDIADPEQAQEPENASEPTTAATEVAASGEGVLEEVGDPAVEPENVEIDTISPKAPPQFAGSLDTSAWHAPDGPPTPTDTGLHPINITYRDYSIPMFKSSRQPDGLLKNDNLASIGLSNLMQDCKHRLKAKLGEEIPEDHDIVLGFDRLGLMLVEGNTSTFDTSLNDIIEIWQQLHYNDGFSDEDVPALAVTLTLQPKFSASIGMLQKAVNDGQGISSVAPTFHAGNDDYGDEVQEAQYTDEHTAHEEQELAAGEEEHYEEQPTANAQEYDEEYHELEGNTHPEEPNEELGQTAQQPEDGYHDGINYELEELEEYPDPEGFDDDHDESGTQAETVDATKEQVETASDEHTESREVQVDEAVAPDSAASSTTVRGDAANDVTETNADHGQDDLSTFLTDYGADAGQEVEEAPGQDTLTAPDPKPAGDNFLGTDSNIPEGDRETETRTAKQQQEDIDELIEYDDDDDFNEADHRDHFNEDEVEPNEDDEQFHTALDLLDGQENEHGPEAVEATELENQTQDPFGDDLIAYDEEEDTAPEGTANGSTHSPLGKRSFDEHTNDDEVNFEEPELKKARSD